MVGLLDQVITTGYDDNIVSVTHVMQATNGTIEEGGFMSLVVSVCEERFNTFLVVEYHDRVNLGIAHWAHYF